MPAAGVASAGTSTRGARPIQLTTVVASRNPPLSNPVCCSRVCNRLRYDMVYGPNRGDRCPDELIVDGSLKYLISNEKGPAGKVLVEGQRRAVGLRKPLHYGSIKIVFFRSRSYVVGSLLIAASVLAYLVSAQVKDNTIQESDSPWEKFL